MIVGLIASGACSVTVPLLCGAAALAARLFANVPVAPTPDTRSRFSASWTPASASSMATVLFRSLVANHTPL